MTGGRTGWTRRGAAALVVTGIVAAACGDAAAPTTPTAVVRDSAGITIVENERPAPGSRLDWTVGPEPTLSIGTLEGAEEYQLFRVSDALRLGDGRIVVVNRGSNELRVFDADGTYLDAWGREGEGPGEFTGVIEVERWAGDSIMVFDFRQRRNSVFDETGVHGRTFLLDNSEDVTAPQFRGVLPDGRLLIQAGAIFTAGEIGSGITRADRRYATLDAEGTDARLLGAFPGDERFVLAGEGFMSVSTHPFGRSTQATGWGERILISANDSYELRAYDQQGELTHVVRRAHEVTTPTQDDLDAYFAERFADADPAEREQQMAMVADMPLVGPFPAFSDIQTDPLGHLWVEEYNRPGEEGTIWSVYAYDGSILGFVETPMDLDIVEVGEDYILGRTTDDFDVEYVQLWPLRRTP